MRRIIYLCDKLTRTNGFVCVYLLHTELKTMIMLQFKKSIEWYQKDNIHKYAMCIKKNILGLKFSKWALAFLHTDGKWHNDNDITKRTNVNVVFGFFKPAFTYFFALLGESETSFKHNSDSNYALHSVIKSLIMFFSCWENRKVVP